MTFRSTVTIKKRARRLNSHINVVPYIDVMLVLLVIFMVTTPLLTPSIVDVPHVKGGATSPESAIEIVLQKNGGLRLIDHSPITNDIDNSTAETEFNASAIVEDARDLNELARLIHEKMQLSSVNQHRPVVISADKGVIYDHVLTLMDKLKTAGIERVGLSVVGSIDNVSVSTQP